MHQGARQLQRRYAKVGDVITVAVKALPNSDIKQTITQAVIVRTRAPLREDGSTCASTERRGLSTRTQPPRYAYLWPRGP